MVMLGLQAMVLDPAPQLERYVSLIIYGKPMKLFDTVEDAKGWLIED